MPPPDIRSLDIAMLRTFDALMRERSVSRAATRLFLSQPAVSASLKRLRDIFDDTLFLREAHGVVPTGRALALAPHVERVLADLARLMSVDRPFDPARSDRVFRVAGSDHASALVLPGLCTALAAAGSRIRLFWESPGFATLAERLRRGDLHFALLPRAVAPAELESRALHDDDYVLAARPSHPALVAGATLDAFCALPHAVLGHGPSALDEQIDQALARAGRGRHLQVAVGSFGQLAALVATTDVVAVLPRRVAASHAAVLRLHDLPLALPRYTLFLAWHRRSNDDPGAMWLVDAIVRSLQRGTV